MGFILNIIASVLKWIFQPICWIWGCIESLIKGEFNKWNNDLAYAKDVWGCTLIKYPANRILIKENSYKFGQKKDTISKVLGINKKNNTLTKIGIVLSNILNKLDKNHVEKAADK